MADGVFRQKSTAGLFLQSVYFPLISININLHINGESARKERDF